MAVGNVSTGAIRLPTHCRELRVSVKCKGLVDGIKWDRMRSMPHVILASSYAVY